MESQECLVRNQNPEVWLKVVSVTKKTALQIDCGIWGLEEGIPMRRSQDQVKQSTKSIPKSRGS
jgi:hypothetical protein